MDDTYIVQVTLSVSVSAESGESAEAGAEDLIKDMFLRDGREVPDVDAYWVGSI